MKSLIGLVVKFSIQRLRFTIKQTFRKGMTFSVKDRAEAYNIFTCSIEKCIHHVNYSVFSG